MKKTDTVVTIDKSGRRRFIRAGGAFLLAGAATASTTTARAQEESPQRSDCDSFGNSENKNPQAARSDSDSGAYADRQGCGTKTVPITYKKEFTPIG